MGIVDTDGSLHLSGICPRLDSKSVVHSLGRGYQVDDHVVTHEIGSVDMPLDMRPRRKLST